MKLITLIFAFYILLLPCLPCNDTDECSKKEETEISKTTTEHKDQHSENEGCNPFCSCVCCGQIFYPTLHFDIANSKIEIINLKQQFFYKNISLPSDFFGNIWQPPKV